jgi:hypothetical protein
MKVREVSGVAGSRFGVPANRGGVLVALVAAGLAVAGLGFVAASIDPGSGPRAVHGAMFLGPLYLPPFLTGLAALAMAGLQVLRMFCVTNAPLARQAAGVTGPRWVS